MNYKNYIAVLLTALVLLLCMLVSCSDTKTDVVGVTVAGIENEEVGAVGPTDEQLAALREIYGISEEELAAIPAEELEALLAEAGYMAPSDDGENENQNNGNNQPAAKRPTYSDISAGGSYVMTVGDSMLWNYMEFHYENGKLVKIVMHFSKDGSEEDTEIMTYEGDAISECQVFDIDYNASPESLAYQLREKMYYESVYIEPVK